MSRTQSVFAIQRQQDVQIHRRLCEKYTCQCSICNVVKNMMMQKKINVKVVKNSTLNSLLTKDQISIAVEHIGKYTRATNTLMLLVKIYSKDNFRFVGQFIIKLAKRYPNETCLELILWKKFENEVRFYTMFAPKCDKSIMPECYLVTGKRKHKTVNIRNDQIIPILLMQDLKLDGYTKCHTKLNVHKLMWCIKTLAWFHGAATKLINEDAGFKPYAKYLENQYYDKFNHLQAIRAFLNNPILKAFDNNFQEKIKTKLKKAQQYLLMKGKVSVLVHGSFTRSNIFFKKVSPESIKFIDFQTVRLGSPAIDLGRILLTNLPDEYTVSELQKFCKNIIEYYIRKLIKKYPLFNKTSVYRDIVNNLFYSYINLDEEENKEIHNHVTILRVLNDLGSFD